MSFKKATLAAAVAATFTGGISAMDTADAGTVAAGTYDLVILTTPITSATTASGAVTTGFNLGTQGNWQSTFTFGGSLPGTTSQVMTDNATLVNGKGSGIAADGFAGIIGVTIDGLGVMTFNTGLIVGGPMTGTMNLTTGFMTMTPTGRVGTVGNFASLVDEPWNIDNFTNTSSTSWTSFTTGSVSVPGAGNTANGKDFSAIADANSDGVSDYIGVLVNAGAVGSAWGGFFSNPYLETWRVRLLSKTPGTEHAGFNVDTIFETAGGSFAQYTNPVPVPAAVWLFGSGLLGLVGVARRRKVK